MLARRGLRPRTGKGRLLFGRALPPVDAAGHGWEAALDDPVAARLVELLGHYAFRLFLRGAILHPDGVVPEEATRYVAAARARAFADDLVAVGLAVRVPPDRIRIAAGPSNFGAILEWYIARELHRWLGFDVATGVTFHASGVGGDLDVVAAAEGKLVYLEVKSSPPKHRSDGDARVLRAPRRRAARRRPLRGGHRVAPRGQGACIG